METDALTRMGRWLADLDASVDESPAGLRAKRAAVPVRATLARYGLEAMGVGSAHPTVELAYTGITLFHELAGKHLFNDAHAVNEAVMELTRVDVA